MSSSDKFSKIQFDDFQKFAKDNTLSKYEKIGFPDSYREGYEELIFSDIRQKLTNLDDSKMKVLDIGPGCSELPNMLINLCEKNDHQLTMVDGPEMLSLLPNKPFVRKVAGLYPKIQNLNGELETFNVVLCYSVLHYILIDTAFYRFLDTSLSLLAPRGQMLIGDVPNVSKRKRFFASQAGKDFHKKFMGTNTLPEVDFNVIEHDQIDDAIVASIIQRSRAQGFDAYVVPQGPGLPMANRREDILIVRP